MSIVSKWATKLLGKEVTDVLNIGIDELLKGNDVRKKVGNKIYVVGIKEIIDVTDKK